MTTGTAARVLERSEDTARRYADAGVLPTTRTPSGVRLFEAAAVYALAARLKAGRRSA